MKRVLITFDDGRNDSIHYALPFLNKYGIKATFFITTGYVDGTYRSDKWYSAEAPMRVEDIIHLRNEGHEIALHGDRHCTNPEDFTACVKKMNTWLKQNSKYGFSLPGSRMTDYPIEKFLQEKKDDILYIRGGNHCAQKKTFALKLRKFFRVYLKSKITFRLYHADDVFKERTTILPAVGIRENDKSSSLISFINRMNDDESVIFTFHSILPISSDYYKKDPWAWSENEFERFCAFLNNEMLQNRIQLKLMKEVCCYGSVSDCPSPG